MPKKKAADEALASLEEKQSALRAEQKKLAQLQKLLATLKIDLELKLEEKEQLIKKVTTMKQ